MRQTETDEKPKWLCWQCWSAMRGRYCKQTWHTWRSICFFLKRALVFHATSEGANRERLETKSQRAARLLSRIRHRTRARRRFSEIGLVQVTSSGHEWHLGHHATGSRRGIEVGRCMWRVAARKCSTTESGDGNSRSWKATVRSPPLSMSDDDVESRPYMGLGIEYFQLVIATVKIWQNWSVKMAVLGLDCRK
jgi:hypothetical protein